MLGLVVAEPGASVFASLRWVHELQSVPSNVRRQNEKRHLLLFCYKNIVF